MNNPHRRQGSIFPFARTEAWHDPLKNAAKLKSESALLSYLNAAENQNIGKFNRITIYGLADSISILTHRQIGRLA